jgi:beta-glucosidase
MRDFPPDFLWGAATASYQIEGATHEDGRGESIWDRFSRIPGNVARGETGDVACDHYHRFREDVDLMATLGLRAYRFSIAWPRVLPDGAGPPNQRGLDFYSALVDRLLERGITPCATLYHWDLPQALEDRGGWLSRDTALRFAEYAELMYRTLGDRVPRWMTHNEPWCAAFLGHFRGVHAPGKRDLMAGLTAAHHILLSHGLAVSAARTAHAGKLGIALSLFPTYPFADGEAHATAAQLSDGYTNRWFLDPVYRGAYPADTRAHLESLAGPFTFIRDGDLEAIAQPIDFLGINYYHRRVIEARPDGDDLGWKVHDRTPGVPTTDLGWEIVPHCFTDLLLRLTRDYGAPPLLVTENGAVFEDAIGPDGTVDDPKRVDFFRRHFDAALAAMQQGARLEGYLVWSLMDNFEWAFGYDKRFGIVYVDYATQRRIPKASARFLSRVIRAGLHG